MSVFGGSVWTGISENNKRMDYATFKKEYRSLIVMEAGKDLRDDVYQDIYTDYKESIENYEMSVSEYLEAGRQEMNLTDHDSMLRSKVFVSKRMSLKPILFSTAMMLANMNLEKTETRRLVKNKEHLADMEGVGGPLHDYNSGYGGIGDFLWFRETFNDGSFLGSDQAYIYKASQNGKDWEQWSEDWKWTPCLFMPKYACRAFGAIQRLRVERLHDITEKGALAEGIVPRSKDGGKTWKYGLPDLDGDPGGCDYGWAWGDWEDTAVAAYKKLWISINGEESWIKNPYVWVIKYKLFI